MLYILNWFCKKSIKKRLNYLNRNEYMRNKKMSPIKRPHSKTIFSS